VVARLRGRLPLTNRGRHQLWPTRLEGRSKGRCEENRPQLHQMGIHLRAFFILMTVVHSLGLCLTGFWLDATLAYYVLGVCGTTRFHEYLIWTVDLNQPKSCKAAFDGFCLPVIMSITGGLIAEYWTRGMNVNAERRSFPSFQMA
jgi:hypothetical protein